MPRRGQLSLVNAYRLIRVNINRELAFFLEPDRRLYPEKNGFWVGDYTQTRNLNQKPKNIYTIIQNPNPKPKNIYTQTQNPKVFISKPKT